MTVTLAELPKAARTLMLTVSNFGGGGLKRVASLQARLMLPGGGKERCVGWAQRAPGLSGLT